MHVTTLSDRPDINNSDAQIITRVSAFTMTSIERLSAMIDSVRYIVASKIPGSIVECGVWRGGSMMAAALAMIEEGNTDRNLYLYDTFDGMSSPDDAVDRSFDNTLASTQLRAEEKGTGIWCKASLDDVRANVLSTGYQSENVHFVKGKVEDTIPAVLPNEIAVLRLDTDWYESTKHELEYLYPRLSKGGLLIIDDYGHWKGARRACDEYFSKLDNPPFLQRIDYTGRLAQVH